MQAKFLYLLNFSVSMENTCTTSPQDNFDAYFTNIMV